MSAYVGFAATSQEGGLAVTAVGHKVTLFASSRPQGGAVPTTTAHKVTLVHSHETKAALCAIAWQQGHLLTTMPAREIASPNDTP